MSATDEEVAAAIRALRECFHRLKAYGDKVHADLGINASMRGVLEALGEADDLTVPQIARNKGVSRQHIQLVVNALQERGLVTISSNPKDARSPLIRITADGRRLFKIVLKREAAILAAFAPQFSGADLAVTRRTLDAFQHVLLGLSASGGKISS